jgi:hypothetical protein
MPHICTEWSLGPVQMCLLQSTLHPPSLICLLLFFLLLCFLFSSHLSHLISSQHHIQHLIQLTITRKNHFYFSLSQESQLHYIHNHMNQNRNAFTLNGNICTNPIGPHLLHAPPRPSHCAPPRRPSIRIHVARAASSSGPFNSSARGAHHSFWPPPCCPWPAAPAWPSPWPPTSRDQPPRAGEPAGPAPPLSTSTPPTTRPAASLLVPVSRPAPPLSASAPPTHATRAHLHAAPPARQGKSL